MSASIYSAYTRSCLPYLQAVCSIRNQTTPYNVLIRPPTLKTSCMIDVDGLRIENWCCRECFDEAYCIQTDSNRAQFEQVYETWIFLNLPNKYQTVQRRPCRSKLVHRHLLRKTRNTYRFLAAKFVKETWITPFRQRYTNGIKIYFVQMGCKKMFLTNRNTIR